MSITLPDPGPLNLKFERPADRARLDRTAAALNGRGFKAQVADNAMEARRLVLDAIPAGAEVHIALSETMRELGITSEIDDSGRYDSVRSRLSTLDRETQGREMRKLGAAPDYIVGSAHAVTDDGEIVVGSGSGSRRRDRRRLRLRQPTRRLRLRRWARHPRDRPPKARQR